ncbi:ATP synthase F1 subunit epsilon [uncultured Clostridium sp.]|uniref:ATP synthase F1 subunit epsilon n=1 Tax=uncultured Clostridium sp. TaxID=59620 RepID=UPI0028EB71BA|nr:ATP synthase F1 subunit epsilon [uncultured Clostridium sp.]
MALFSLKVVTSNGIFFDEEVDMAILRCVNGDIGILKGHAPLISLIGIGKLRIKQNGKIKEAAIAGGYVEVNKEDTLIVCDAIEWPNEIDIERVKEAKRRAEERLQNPDGIDVARAEVALKKAINRINTAEIQ